MLNTGQKKIILKKLLTMPNTAEYSVVYTLEQPTRYLRP